MVSVRVARGLIVVVLLALVGAACGRESPTVEAPPPEPTETTLAECVIDQGTVEPAKATGMQFTTLKPGTLVVGSDTAFPPFESIEGGKAVGFDIDLIDEIAKRLNLQTEVQSSSFDTIFTSLAAKKFDVVISAVTIKESRKETVDFTDPYFRADQSLTVRTADATDVRGVDDLEGEVVGAQAGTTGADCAENALKAKGLVQDVRTYETAPAAFDDLGAGRITGVVNDLPTSKQIVESKKGLRTVQIIRTDEEYGIAVTKDNPNLREEINRVLADLKQDGTYRTMFVEWFKTEPPEE